MQHARSRALALVATEEEMLENSFKEILLGKFDIHLLPQGLRFRVLAQHIKIDNARPLRGVALPKALEDLLGGFLCEIVEVVLQSEVKKRGRVSGVRNDEVGKVST
eukprot:CAMPEP_0195020924 /NCGR_PEP_ID=MMETSP0326_2-20130528/36627_1 /TAXON_ID=2866 ORGANISM="Crypthecodinium cohnii, Strain Seligo" /NCGR_SAMPLE_ID=MMETSP0326_2 /ASSEMBLY_ACC=CAM_ASM_000348 /LENGTH=105 /DNA_ID=CAMNT_0040039855 /DNA_START=214 /DNA_END=527 /DNA_ORIENTATION=+